MAHCGSETVCTRGAPALRPFPLRHRAQRGQMTVELAVCIPVILAVVGIALNVLGYMNVCARFDRVAADATRSQASSPGYGEEGTARAADRIQEVIETAFQSGLGKGFNCDIEVTATALALGGEEASASGGVGFSLLTRLERYDCTVTYHPWPFSQIAGLRFFALTHTRSYVVDPFKPGVVF
ncbi:MAG: hypothetical protein LBL23_07440 [Coriobacteriales bacterium]|nr:hypothetical protein [Coriobacteriales bacterium]